MESCIVCGNIITGKPRYTTEYGFMKRGPFCGASCQRTYAQAKESKPSSSTGTSSSSYVEVTPEPTTTRSDAEMAAALKEKVRGLKGEGKMFQAFVMEYGIYIAVALVVIWFVAMQLLEKVSRRHSGEYAFYIICAIVAVGAYFYVKDYFKKS